MSLTRARVALGRAILLFGLVVLAYIPYVLWGTGLVTARHQDALRTQFDRALAARHEHPSAPVAPPASTAPRVAPVEPEPATGSVVGLIDIPRIGLHMAIVQGVATAQLEAGPGHYPSTPMPGQAGNAAIAGHRTTYLHPFYSLDALQPGDQIRITTLQGVFTYAVLSQQTVLPTDVAVVDPTVDPELTLTTCTPRYSASHRLVVHARLVASSLAGPPAATTSPTTVPPPSPRPPAAADGLAGSTGSWLAAALWGAGFLAAVALVAALARGRSRRVRTVVVVAGLVPVALVLFGFFAAVTPLLPASF